MNNQGQEVGGHRPNSLEVGPGPVVVKLYRARLHTVGQSAHVLSVLDLYVKRRLEGRLVKAGQHAASVGSFHLGAGCQPEGNPTDDSKIGKHCKQKRSICITKAVMSVNVVILGEMSAKSLCCSFLFDFVLNL